MEVAIIFLCASIMGCLFVLSFYLGMKYQKTLEKGNTFELTKENAKAYSDLIEWLHYGGKK